MKTLATLAIAGVVAAAAMTAPKPAEAGWRHGYGGGAVAAGVIGGLALGAIAAGAYRGGYYGYGYGPGYASYGYEPAYYGAYAYGPECFIRRHRVWTSHGWIIRRVRVCN